MNKLLLVEDDKALAEYVVTFLQQNDFQVELACDLAQGMDICCNDFDVVLLDICLLGDTCFPILEKVKKEKPETIVIMLTANDSDEFIRQAKISGADGFLPKPFNLKFLENTLLPQINLCLRRRRFKK